MRDLMVLGAMLFIVPIALANAFAAYLLWGWTAMIVIPYYLYGFMGSLRYNFFFAVVAISLALIGRIKDKGQFSLNSTTVLLILFSVHGGVCMALAYGGLRDNVSIYTDLLKSMAYCLMMGLFVTSRLRLHAMMLVIALGLAFHGVVEGLKVFASGGGHKIIGIPGSKMSDNNHYAAAMVMVLPILLYLYQYSKFRLVRWGLMGALGLTVFSVVGSNSRGGFLAMVAVALVLLFNSRRKFLSLAVVAIGFGLVLTLSPDRWFERIDTIGDAGRDDSFMGRVEAWNVSTAIALANPLVGGGFHAVQDHAVWNLFRPHDGLLTSLVPPAQSIGARAAHSNYFEVLGDLGFVGLFLYLAILINALMTARTVRRIAKQHGDSLMWARDMGDALSLAIVAYAVGGGGVSLAYFETFYVLAMLLEVLKQIILAQTQPRKLAPHAVA
nr:putative O-glycosylation ligase, exosortase A system-associated [Variovorax boronicumulans]